jgi:hypothetical protein
MKSEVEATLNNEIQELAPRQMAVVLADKDKHHTHRPEARKSYKGP